MKTSAPLWRSIESSGACSGVRAVWREVLGQALPSFWPFLKARRGLTCSYPCPFPGPDGCPREVVSHPNGEIAAVCRSSHLSCERLALSKADLVVYSLDVDRLAHVLGESFALEKPEGETGVPRTWLLGVFSPAAGVECPVYLCLPRGPLDLELAVERLALRAAGAFVVVVPTASVLSPGVATLLKLHDGTALTLEHVTALDEDGAVVVRRERVKERLSALGQRLLTAAFARRPRVREGVALFPTPPRATWADLSIRFRDGETVSIAAKDRHAVLTYSQLGMATRSARPTVQWHLLRQFADGHGLLAWQGSGASRLNQKRRERLARDLRIFFGIEGDPIEVEGTGWRCKFALEPEGP